MPRRRTLTPLALAATVLFACGELRVASQAADAGEDVSDPGEDPIDGDGASSSSSKDGGTKKDGSTGTDAGKDAGQKDSGAPPVTCDGPCPPEPIATGLSQATALTVDAVNVYFAVEGGPGNGTVYQCPKTGCGGPPIKLGEGYAMKIVVAGGQVYWGDFSAGKLVSCAVGGCNDLPTTVVPNQPSIKGTVTDELNLFWLTNGAVKYCPRATCSSATTVTINADQGFFNSMAAEQGKVIWPYNGKIFMCSPGPCPTPTELGPGSIDVSIHGGDAFWVTSAKNVVRCPLSGCNKTPLTIGSSQTPRFPVSDGANVYWRDDLYRHIYRCPESGCAPGPEILATQQSMQPNGQIALDGTHVYWTTTTGVYRLKK